MDEVKYLLDKLLAKSEGKVSLVQHLKDTVVEALKLKSFVERNEFEISIFKYEDSIFEDKDNFFKALVKASFLHDLGKILYSFQKEVYGKEFMKQDLKQLREFLSSTRDLSVRDHEFFSALWSIILLKDNSTVNQVIRSAVLLHHYNNFYSWGNIFFSNMVKDFGSDIIEYFEMIDRNKNIFSELLGGMINIILDDERLTSEDRNFLKNALGELDIEMSNLEEIKENLNEEIDVDSFQFYSPNLIEKEKDRKIFEFLFFLGSLRRCDYSSSGGVNIELENKLTNMFDVAEERINKIIQEKRGKNWQSEIINRYNEDKVILVAPTGSGKTEFAILWAKKKNKKLLYTLPLRVALNDLYSRFKGENKNIGYFGSKNVGLLHSTSYIEYLKEESNVSIETKISSAKILSEPVLLSTPDQVLLTSLNYYGSDKVLSVFPFSTLVLDEIQTYTPEMAAIIIKSIKEAIALGSSVLVMTATYPLYFNKFFNEFKMIDVSKEGVIIKNLNNKRHKIEIVNLSLFKYKKTLQLDNKSKNKIEDIIKSKKHKNWLIILNNVSKAVTLYNELAGGKDNKKFPSKRVYLLHSRMTEKRKKEVIDEVREGMTSEEGVILIATQIVEASVDLDFDALITEVSPIDSQIQRWGRVFRNKGNKDYDGGPNIFIFVGDNEESIDRGTAAIYDKDVVSATIRKLIEDKDELKNKVLSYIDEKKLVDEIFESEVDGKIIKKKYENRINEILDKLNYFNAAKKSEAQKIFRRIAGVQVVFPDLMKYYATKISKSENSNTISIIGDVILNFLDSGNYDPSWDEVIERVDEKGAKWDNAKEDNKEYKKYLIKSILDQFSINIPIFFFDKIGYKLKQFKGYYVFEFYESENNDNKLKKLYELGICKETIKELDWEENYILY